MLSNITSLPYSPNGDCRFFQPPCWVMGYRIITSRPSFHVGFCDRLNGMRHSPGKGVVTHALFGSQHGQSNWDSENISDRRKFLLTFVQQATPGAIDKADVPAQVVSAMRQTVTSMLGTLPPQFFTITIAARDENVAQLMFSVLMTGYMFKSAWTRLDLAKSMSSSLSVSSPSSTQSLVSIGGSIDEIVEVTEYAEGSQKLEVNGNVLRWHHENGAESIPALQYIEHLEEELGRLKRQLTEEKNKAAPGPGSNDLLDWLKLQTPEGISELTDCASDDVLEAMNAFVQALMASEDGQGTTYLADGHSSCTATEMAKLLYWLMVMGWQLRCLEIRLNLSMHQMADGGADASNGFLPPPQSREAERLVLAEHLPGLYTEVKSKQYFVNLDIL